MKTSCYTLTPSSPTRLVSIPQDMRSLSHTAVQTRSFTRQRLSLTHTDVSQYLRTEINILEDSCHHSSQQLIGCRVLKAQGISTTSEHQ